MIESSQLPQQQNWARNADLPAFGEIQLWLTSYDEIADESLLRAYRELLDPAERQQEPRFHFARDRRRYLVTRALVRTVMARYLSIDPRSCMFHANAYGRPALVNREAVEAELSFNISHTHSLIALAVSRRRELGVDVENVRAREVSIDVADHYFAPAEVAALHELPANRQQYRFFEYWTFKEAYIKARGMGLSLPLDAFSFHYPDDESVEIAIDAELADDPSRWQFWQFRPTPDYLVAICGERTVAGAARVTVREIVPLVNERDCVPEFLRVSGGRADISQIATGD